MLLQLWRDCNTTTKGPHHRTGGRCQVRKSATSPRGLRTSGSPHRTFAGYVRRAVICGGPMPPWIMQGIRCAALSGGLLLPDIVNADIIKCSFTEPFITTSYDTALKRLAVTYDVEQRQRIHDRISMRELRPGA